MRNGKKGNACGRPRAFFFALPAHIPISRAFRYTLAQEARYTQWHRKSFA